MIDNNTPQARTQLDEIRRFLDKGKRKRVRRILGEMHPAKVAGILESLPPVERMAAWEQVEPEVEEVVLQHLQEELRIGLTRESDLPTGPEPHDTRGVTHLARVREAIDQGKLKRVGRILKEMHPAKIAGLLESLPPRERSKAWEMVAVERSGKVLKHLHEEVVRGLVAETDIEDLMVAAQHLPLDDLVDLIQDLPEPTGRELLQGLDLKQRQRLETMLAYPEESAGGLMNTDHVSVRADVSLHAVLRYLRLLDELPENLDKILVVDRKDRYQGIVRLRRLLTSSPESFVRQLMETDFPAIPATLPSREVARRFQDLDLVSAPVVDARGRLLGRITVDDVVDVIRDESERSLMHLAGLDEEGDMFAPVLTSTRRRAVWLGVNLLTAFLAAWVIGLFEGILEKVVALAVLMPIVASMGGIAGSQTLTLVIRGLALDHLERGNARLLLLKELGIGLLNGLIWALVVAALAIAWFGNWAIGGIIAAAILLNLLCAALAGVVIPLFMRRAGIDPALAGNVVLTTVTDVVGFFAFLGLATVLLL